VTYPQIRQPARFGPGLDDFRKQIERAIGGRVESGSSLTLGTPGSITSDYTVAAGDFLLPVDASSAAVTITLPLAAQSLGRTLIVKKTDSSGNAVTLDGNGSETIDGSTTAVVSVQYVALMVMCDGTEWWIV